MSSYLYCLLVDNHENRDMHDNISVVLYMKDQKIKLAYHGCQRFENRPNG